MMWQDLFFNFRIVNLELLLDWVEKILGREIKHLHQNTPKYPTVVLMLGYSYVQYGSSNQSDEPVLEYNRYLAFGTEQKH